MTQDQYNALRATFPWTERSFTVPHKQGGIIQIVDRFGREVPLFTICQFLAFITTKLTQATAAGATETPKDPT